MKSFTVRVREDDIEIAKLYRQEHPRLHRGALGILLERDGLGLGHHTFSGAFSREQYINTILDEIETEEILQRTAR